MWPNSVNGNKAFLAEVKSKFIDNIKLIFLFCFFYQVILINHVLCQSTFHFESQHIHI